MHCYRIRDIWSLVEPALYLALIGLIAITVAELSR